MEIKKLEDLQQKTHFPALSAPTTPQKRAQSTEDEPANLVVCSTKQFVSI